jgi:hypothetical protein
LYENQTNRVIHVKSYSGSGVDEVQLDPQSTHLIMHHSGMGRAELDIHEYDSIIVSNGIQSIRYARDSSSNNAIYDFENWKEEKAGRHRYSYTYPFHDGMFQ